MSQLVVGELANNLKAVAVIMAGGSGTRFWPMSRSSLPKQFLPLAGSERSLIQVTAERVEPLVGSRGVMVVTADSQKELVLEHLPQACVLIEPVPRNTSPCIGYAAVQVLRTLGDIPMLCLPADHVVSGQKEITEVYARGIRLALEQDVLVTIGIQPGHPETGYGYIRRGEPYVSDEGEAYQVRQFVEKPDAQTAVRYVESGEYFWNSGMFIWRPSVILKAIAQHLPALKVQLDKIGESLGQPDGYSLAAEAYGAIAPVSIDTGVLEKAKHVIMLPGNTFAWSDVGAWSSWAEVLRKDGRNSADNYTKGDVLLLDSRGCTIVGEKRLIAGVGLSDLVIIDTADALLICRADCSQDVKKIVDQLKAKGRKELV